jgi:integrase
VGRASNKLTVKYCERKDLAPGLYGDGSGLYLQVSAFNTKAWVFRFMIAGHARKMGLGEFKRLSLAEARKKAQAAYAQVVDGIDPIEARNAVKAAQATERAKFMSFEDCAKQCIGDRAQGWKYGLESKHGKQWISTLETYAYPVIGKLSVDKIDLALVLKVIKPIWQDKTETASRVRQRIEIVLDWAKVHGHRTGDNPARWKGFLDQILPAPSQVSPVQHFAALPYADLPDFMTKLRQRDSISARALEFTILTAMRTEATTGAKLSEIDLDSATWTIPAARLKGKKGKVKRDLVIPLPERAVQIIKDTPSDGTFVFMGGKAGKGLSNAAMSELLKGMIDPSEATVHGFRSTFKDWATEQTEYPLELSEFALAHTVSGKVEAAYRRGDMIEKRRRLMEDWATYCEGRKISGDNVVKIGAR